MGNRKRITQLIAIILLVCLVILILGYFLYTFLKTNDAGIEQSEFGGKLYASEDVEVILEFSDDASSAELRLDGVHGGKQNLALTYEENLFTGTTETETFYFLVLDENKLYTSTGVYLHTAKYAK